MAVSVDMLKYLSVDADYVYPCGPLWDGVSFVQEKPTPRELKK
jgi:hypothetical protein